MDTLDNAQDNLNQDSINDITQDNANQESGDDTIPSEGEVSQDEDTESSNPATDTSDTSTQNQDSTQNSRTQTDRESNAQDNLNADQSDSQESGDDTPADTQTPELDVSQLTEADLQDVPLYKTPFENPSADQSRIEALKALRDEIITQANNSNNVLIHTHYSCIGIAELLDISRDLFAFYSYHCDNLRISNKNYNDLKASLETITSYINESLLKIATFHKTSLEIYHNCEKILDDTQLEISQLSGDIDKAKATLNAIEEIKASITDIESLNAELKALIAQGSDMQLQIQVLSQGILQEMQATLLTTKEGFESELYEKKEAYIALFNEKLALMQEKTDNFITLKAQAKSEAQNALNQINAFKEQLVKYYHNANVEHINNLSALKEALNQHKISLEAYKEAKIEELRTFTQELRQGLDYFTQQKQEQLDNYTLNKENELHTATQNHFNTLNTLKDDILREVSILNTAEVMHVRDLFYQIQNSKAILGSDYQSITYTQNATFTPQAGVKNYFVFIRGGTGADNATTQGGVTSFGELLSVNGGAGNNTGTGQMGESTCAFITLTDESEINVVVGTGGICTISWAGSEVESFDYHFLNSYDIAYLKSDTQDNQSFLDSIQNTRDYNFYQSLVSIANGLHLGDLESYTQWQINNKTLIEQRHLRLEIAHIYLTQGGDINSILRSVTPSGDTPEQINPQVPTTPDESGENSTDTDSTETQPTDTETTNEQDEGSDQETSEGEVSQDENTESSDTTPATDSTQNSDTQTSTESAQDNLNGGGNLTAQETQMGDTEKTHTETYSTQTYYEDEELSDEEIERLGSSYKG